MEERNRLQDKKTAWVRKHHGNHVGYENHNSILLLSVAAKMKINREPEGDCSLWELIVEGLKVHANVLVQSHLHSKKIPGVQSQSCVLFINWLWNLKTIIFSIIFSIMTFNSIIYPSRNDENCFLPVTVKISLKLVSFQTIFYPFIIYNIITYFNTLFLSFASLFILFL